MAPKPTLKLLIDRNTNKVLFGEANKDMVDFLFAILAYPVGLVTKLLTENGMAGSIGNLYKSLKDLPDEYIQPNTDKNMYLKPELSIPTISQAALLLGLQEKPAPAAVPSSTLFVTFGGNPSGQVFGPSSGGGGGKGCVKGVVRYMVMDNLEVAPMSGISSMTLLNKFHVKDLTALVEKEVEVGRKEALALLKASFESKTVLTDVFGGKPTSIGTPSLCKYENQL
ncbi:hypothetical protein ACLOJK_028101 [Asimina triloba]